MYIQKIFIAILFITISAIGPLVGVHKASAVTAADWRAGRIIDDGIFTNANDMSVADIQAFLNAKVPVCDSQGTKSVGYYYSAVTGQPKFSWFSGGSWVTTTRAVFAQRYSAYYQTNISNLPFTCLKDYYEVPKTAPGPGLPASNAFGQPIPAGAVSAAQMIRNAAVKYNINPKVLLVKLHTESAGPLTTDDWPFQNQYLYAMGAQCPDSGPGGSANCNSNYAGFSIQIDEAAALLRWYLDSMTQSWWQYKKPYQTNSILWNVEPSGCGAGNVYIESKATAALYTYTPYQPNAAALANLYGTGDGCSVYGNRNFWRVYNDWFGSSIGQTYSWSLVRQEAFTDNTKTSVSNLSDLKPGQRRFLSITVQNNGVSTWSNTGSNPVRLGTSRPYERASSLYDPSWLGYSRPAVLKESSVPPGQNGTFEFWVQAPEIASAKDYKEYFTPLAEGREWMQDIGLYYNLHISPNNYSWDILSQYAFTDETKTKAATFNSMEPGQRIYAGMVIKNTGDVTWTNSGTNPLNLGASNPRERVSAFYDSTWLTATRPARMKEASVAPGQTATFEFWMKAPINYHGAIYEYFTPVLEYKNWLNEKGLNYSGSILLPLFSWSVLSQYAYTDITKTVPMNIANMTQGQSAYVGLVVRNTSNVTWYNTGQNPINIGTFRLNDRISLFCDSTTSWLSCARPARMKEASVAPGQTATFEFWMKAPNKSGTYREYLNLVAEGKVWLPDIGLYYVLSVQP